MKKLKFFALLNGHETAKIHLDGATFENITFTMGERTNGKTITLKVSEKGDEIQLMNTSHNTVEGIILVPNKGFNIKITATANMKIITHIPILNFVRDIQNDDFDTFLNVEHLK